MDWLTPNFEPVFVFAACVLLFGFAAILLLNRKARPSPRPFANPTRSVARPAHNYQAAYESRPTVSSSQSSALTLSITATYAPRQETKDVEESVAQLMAPLKSPALVAHKEVVLDSLAAPLTGLASGEPSENEAPETHKTETEESNASAPAIDAEEQQTETVQLIAPLAAQNETPLDTPTLPLAHLTIIAPSENEVSVPPKSRSEETTSISPAIEEVAHIAETQTDQEIALTAVQDVAVDSTSALGSAAAEAQETESSAISLVPETVPVVAQEKLRRPHNLLEFHGLKQQPFDVTPDPAYLYFTPSHSEALSSLRLGIEHLRGFMMLVAEPGMGKTTLMNKLMEELADSARVVFLFQTQCSSSELLGFILDELEVDHTGMGVVAMHRALNQALLEEMLCGHRFVLIVDEAQNLQEPVLETIRLLSDFETTHSKLIQIVLVGQPQLAQELMQQGLKQLRQRVAILTSLKPLTAAETAEYVEHRLRAAGLSGGPLFTPEALARIAESSEGVPRSINNLCFNALLEAFESGKEIVDADIVEGVAERLNLEALATMGQERTAVLQSGARTDEPTRAAPAVPIAVTPQGLDGAANTQPKPKSGVTVYIGDEQEASLRAGKSVRIRIDQD